MLILVIIAIILAHVFAISLCKSASEADKELSNFSEEVKDVE